eukprot:6195243-Pleurochrysis_carterae.AAC.4
MRHATRAGRAPQEPVHSWDLGPRLDQPCPQRPANGWYAPEAALGCFAMDKDQRLTEEAGGLRIKDAVLAPELHRLAIDLLAMAASAEHGSCCCRKAFYRCVRKASGDVNA